LGAVQFADHPCCADFQLICSGCLLGDVNSAFRMFLWVLSCKLLLEVWLVTSMFLSSPLGSSSSWSALIWWVFS
jgi:hypothetical protein